MTTNITPQMLDQRIKAMRIIIAALCFGVVFFGAVAILGSQAGQPSANPLICWIGLGGAVVSLLARQFMRSFLETTNRKAIASGDVVASRSKEPTNVADTLLGVYQVRLIISAALLEGACFFNLIAYMIDMQWWSLAIAGVFLAINLSTIPTKDGVESWIQQQLELIDFDRNQAT